MVGSKLKRMSTAEMIIAVIVTLIAAACLIPFVYMIALSLSSNDAIIQQKVGLLPVDLNFETYKTILHDKNMLMTMAYTIALTVGSTALCMFMTICAAYPLTKRQLKGRRALMSVFVVTMYFGGGMIPDYMMVKNLHLLNTVWSLLLPGALSVFNMIILKSFFMSLPAELEESASIEGCSEAGILFRIILPLSLPSLATLSLFYAVGRWNGFNDALYYITSRSLYPIQLKIYQIISANQQLDIQQAEGNMGAHLTPEALKAASVMFATVPILLVYPKLQKYFVQGVMTGALKG